jgi:hypothetical protein
MKYNILLNKVQAYYYSKTNKKLSIHSIRKILRTHFDLKYKHFRLSLDVIATSTFQNERYIFIKLLIKLLQKNFLIIYIDESCFNFYYEKRKLWFNTDIIYKKGNIDYCNQYDNQQFILAKSFNKIIYYEKFSGNNNSLTFNNFLDNMFNTIHSEHPDIELSKTYFFMDNSRVHDSEMTYNNFKRRGCKILWGIINYSNMIFANMYLDP